MKNYFSIFAILFISITVFEITNNNLNAQQVEVLVLSKEDSAPIPFAHICLENLKNKDKKYQVTDADGKAFLSINDPTLCSASFVGYETMLDTLLPSSQRKIYELNLSDFDIEEVVVTGQHKAVTSDNSIYKINLLDNKLIEQKAANNLAELLSSELNIKLSHDPSTGTSMKLQGISGENVKILIDGVPVIGRLNGNIDLSQIDLSNVDHIEVVEGPMSVLYGSNALAGVINIISKENKYANFKSTIHSYYESIGTYNLNTNLAYKKKKSNFLLNAGRNFFSGFDVDTSDRKMEYKPKEQYNLGFNYSYTYKKIDIRYKTDYFKERLLDRSNLIRDPYKVKGLDTWYYTNRINNSIQIKHKLSTNSNYDFMFAYSYYNRSSLKYLKDMSNLESELSSATSDHDTTIFNAISTRGTYNFSKTIFSLQTGFDINTEKGKGKRMKDGEEAIGDYAIFSGIIWDINPSFSVQTGLRASYNTKYDAPVVPSLNLKYNYNKINLRASYSRGFRAPSLKELYLYFFDSNHQIQGNEDLKAEYSHNFLVSSSFKLNNKKNKLIFDVKAYYNIIENRITLVNTDLNNPLEYSNKNIGHFESVGAEANVKFSFIPLVTINAGYSRLGFTDILDENTFIFSNNMNTNITFYLLKNTLSLSLFYKFIGKYPFYTEYNKTLQLNHLDSYHNLDFNLSQKLKSNRYLISAGVKNIFNNIEIGGAATTTSAHGGSTSGVSNLAGWGRTYFIGLKINLVKY